MINDPLFILAVIACFAVLGILALGLGGFARGGDFNRKHANRLMRYRIAAQAVAVVLIIGLVLVRKMGGE
ncbi:MAG: twin transmembrane helix small protein [Paracoccaceae bacterium]